jgi:hypothetical protein
VQSLNKVLARRKEVGRLESELSVYIPWAAEAQLSESVTGKTFVGQLRDCVWTYLELEQASRDEALIIVDAAVPLDGGRASKVLEAAEIEWLIDRLGNDVYRPAENRGRWI